MSYDKLYAERKEVHKAYADCIGDAADGGDRSNYLNEIRCLNFFLMSMPVDGQSWAQIMSEACPDGYNGFTEISIAAVVEFFGNDATYYFAREGSPCVYIRPKHRAWVEKFPTLLADEVSIEESGLIRLWWD